MMKSRLMIMVIAFGLVTVLILTNLVYAYDTADTILKKRAYIAAYNAYIYGFAPVKARSVEIALTSVDYPLEDAPAPKNIINSTTRLFDYRDTIVPTLNNDTLYVSAWMGLKNSPFVLSIPPVKNRYFIVQLLNIYTEAIENLTVENVGENGGNYAFILDSQKNQYKNLPEGVTPIYCDTPTFWLIGRVGVTDEADIEASRKVAEAFTLTPLELFAENKITPRLKQKKSGRGAPHPLWAGSWGFTADLMT